jgi:uncharacterized membrane protein
MNLILAIMPMPMPIFIPTGSGSDKPMTHQDVKVLIGLFIAFVIFTFLCNFISLIISLITTKSIDNYIESAFEFGGSLLSLLNLIFSVITGVVILIGAGIWIAENLL